MVSPGGEVSVKINIFLELKTNLYLLENFLETLLHVVAVFVVRLSLSIITE